METPKTWKKKRTTTSSLEEAKEANKLKNNELNRSEDEDVPLKEDLFIEADSSSDHDSDNEHEGREYEFSYEDAKKTYTEWIDSLERDDSK